MQPDYFALLGLSPQFDLDSAKLEAAYFREQRAWHPDRFAGKSAEERQQAMSRSVDINNAYQTLKSPLARAQYLLRGHGICIGTEQDSVKPSSQLLAETMQWRESAEAAPDVAALNAQDAKLKELEEKTIWTISQFYLAADWQSLAQETLRLSYLEKTREEIALLKHRLKKQAS